jgi:hypothetical protein
MIHVPQPDTAMIRSADLLYAYLCGQEAKAGDASDSAEANTAFKDDAELREQYELGLAGRPMNGAASAAEDKLTH